MIAIALHARNTAAPTAPAATSTTRTA
jgi:hypothetical protein